MVFGIIKNMNKVKAKVFTIFWLISGIVWTIASVKRFINKDDTIIVVVYAITAIVAFLLAFSFYKRLKK